jgi:hypothetical protein
MRLYPTAVADANKLIEAKVVEIDYKTLAKVWKYKMPNTGSFYRRLNSLLAYGLLEAAGTRGRFRVTQLAKDLYHPMNDEHRKNLYKQAVMNIPLWKELHTHVGKEVPPSIYVHLKNITGAEPAEVEKAEAAVRKWYFEDISLVPEEILPKHYSANIAESVSVSDSVSAFVARGDANTTTIPFGDMSVTLPKHDIVGSWDLLQQYMKLYLKTHPQNPDRADNANSSSTDS